MCEWNFTSEMMLTMIMTVISKAKNTPANLVEIEIPRYIMNAAKAKKISVHTPQGRSPVPRRCSSSG